MTKKYFNRFIFAVVFADWKIRQGHAIKSITWSPGKKWEVNYV